MGIRGTKGFDASGGPTGRLTWASHVPTLPSPTLDDYFTRKFMLANRWTTLGILFLVRISMGFQFQSIASVSPLLIEEMGIGYTEIGTLIGLFMFPGVVIALPGGLLGKRFGDKQVCVTGLALMVVGGVLVGTSESYAIAFAGRLLSGIGAVLFNVVLTKMVADWFAGKEIVTAFGVMLSAWQPSLVLSMRGRSTNSSPNLLNPKTCSSP